MGDAELAQRLLELLGDRENVVSNVCCMTRLRVGVRDADRVDVDAIRATEGVLGLVEGQTMQVVLGPGKVDRVLAEFSRLTGIASQQVGEDAPAAVPASPAAGNPARAFLRHVANVFVALMPGTVAAGLIMGLGNLVTTSTGGALDGVWWFQGIRSMGWALYAYLPLLVGYNAAREFGGSAVLGGIAGAMCIANTSMPLLSAGAANPADAILLPLTSAEYNPSAGGLLAALVAGALFAAIERQLRKALPDAIATFLSPLLVLVMGSFVLMLVVQPVSALLTSGIYVVATFLCDQLGILGGYVLAVCQLPLVSVGLHQALTPIHAMLNDPDGPTQGINYLLPILMMAGGGQVGAGLALCLKSRSRKLRRLVAESIPVAILGVGEPLMYAVTLPLFRPFVTACLGAGVGGALASALHLGTVSQGVSGLFGLLIVMPGQQLSFALCMLVSYAAGFALTWAFGVDEERIAEVCGK